jgi:hypothetical protein
MNHPTDQDFFGVMLNHRVQRRQQLIRFLSWAPHGSNLFCPDTWFPGGSNVHSPPSIWSRHATRALVLRIGAEWEPPCWKKKLQVIGPLPILHFASKGLAGVEAKSIIAQELCTLHLSHGERWSSGQSSPEIQMIWGLSFKIGTPIIQWFTYNFSHLNGGYPHNPMGFHMFSP